jgi:hypothetical protein
VLLRFTSRLLLVQTCGIDDYFIVAAAVSPHCPLGKLANIMIQDI